MTKTTKAKAVSSTRSTNRLKQVKFLCAFTCNSGTAILHDLDPENFEEQLRNSDYLDEITPGMGYKRHWRSSNDNQKYYKKHKAEFIAELDNLATYFKLSDIETLIMLVLFNIQVGGNNDDVSVSDITTHLDINGLDGLPICNICSDLAAKDYISISYGREGENEYNITSSVIESIKLNSPELKLTPSVTMDMYKFIAKASEFVHHIDKYHILKENVEKLERSNPQVEFVQRLKSDQHLKIQDRIFLYEIANDRLRGYCSDLVSTCDDIFEDEKCFSIQAICKFKEEEHILQIGGYAEVHASSFTDKTVVSLTDHGLDVIFGDDKVALQKENSNDKKLTKCDDIPLVELFYDDELGKEISFLESSLSDEQFRKLQDKLEKKSMHKGIAVLFYGAPGTGKTETVMQLAKRTGRKVYHVDISASKTCWYGESEKLIKGIFTNYQKMCKAEEKAPILLFNEADALLSKRMSNTHSSVDQTENAIQNILLEEIENLKGIMIATTNLSGNLDSAFERRFLMKVKFEKPSVKSKTAIWHNKLPGLAIEDCAKLAEKYDFSGGEIDNIVRKMTMAEVLYDTVPTIEELCSLCDKEHLQTTERRPVGF